MAATTTLLDLVTPTQGTLSGTWGDTVNYGISDYLDIAIAGTLSFTGDAPVTLINTIGSASGNNIGSTTGQYACIRVTATTAATKVITGPSSSRTYLVDNASSFAITFKATGQAGVSVAAGEKTIVFYNGTDYVKVSSIGSTGILSPAGGGTGIANNAASTLAISGNFATTLTVSGTTGVTLPTTGTLATLAGSETLSNKTLTAPALGTPASGILSACTVDGTNLVGYKAIPQSGSAKTSSYTLATGDVGEFIEVGASGSIVVPNSVFSAGDAVVIFNNTSGAITLTMTITTAYIGGTDADKATISLATRGICNVLFISGTVCVVTGNVT
jgi:hypothetical protein